MTRVVRLNPFSYTVYFTPAQVEFIRELAFTRNREKVANYGYGVRNRRMKDRGDEETHRIGIAGELAVALTVGMAIDEQFYLHNPNPDLILHGVRIEVKNLQGFLVFNSADDLGADVAVLCHHDKFLSDQVTIQGWVTKKLFLDACFEDDFGYGPRLCMQPVHLLPIQTLATYCMTRNALVSIFEVATEARGLALETRRSLKK